MFSVAKRNLLSISPAAVAVTLSALVALPDCAHAKRYTDAENRLEQRSARIVIAQHARRPRKFQDIQRPSQRVFQGNQGVTDPNAEPPSSSRLSSAHNLTLKRGVIGSSSARMPGMRKTGDITLKRGTTSSSSAGIKIPHRSGASEVTLKRGVIGSASKPAIKSRAGRARPSR